jgi:hypothetical protein
VPLWIGQQTSRQTLGLGGHQISSKKKFNATNANIVLRSFTCFTCRCRNTAVALIPSHYDIERTKRRFNDDGSWPSTAIPISTFAVFFVSVVYSLGPVPCIDHFDFDLISVSRARIERDEPAATSARSLGREIQGCSDRARASGHVSTKTNSCTFSILSTSRRRTTYLRRTRYGRGADEYGVRTYVVRSYLTTVVYDLPIRLALGLALMGPVSPAKRYKIQSLQCPMEHSPYIELEKGTTRESF